KLEKVEYHKDIHVLRLGGPITEGPEDVQLSSYHTLSIDTDSVLTIHKARWKPYHMDRLKKAKQRRPLLFICSLDREEADFAGLRESGIEWAGSVRAKKSGQRTGKQERGSEYYQEILGALEKNQGFEAIVLAGPGFEKDNLLKFIQEKNPSLARKIIPEKTSSAGRRGIQEVIQTSANRLLKETRVAKETELVENLLMEASRDGPVVYGKKETEHALGMGAVERLLVSEEMIHDFEGILDEAEKLRTESVVISSEHESGEKFLGIGGIGGFLRFRLR
ncbi:MAG: mRNA surveillance protein pelota, partial [Candidatus Aenigmarchaeota archaeon]|nr:mRNA surveillance protein pelota [Candidatus Aenigmarchaeota archaeon]